MIIFYDQIDSTNRIAKELAAEGKPSGTVVLAATQSAGRGQYGRSFSSPVGGLYFSLLLEPDLPIEILPLITLATGLACRDTLHRNFNLHPLIKWPNDIYLDGKKIAGILCENILRPGRTGAPTTVIIGVGLNVNNSKQDFAVELQPLITTLFECLHKSVELAPLLSCLTQAITARVAQLQVEQTSLLAEWQQFDYLLHKPVVYMREGETLFGVGQGISAQGLYRIHDEHGVEHQVIGGQLRPRE